MNESELQLYLDKNDILDHLQFLHAVTLRAAEEIVYLRGQLEISTKYSEKISAELTGFRTNTYASKSVEKG